VVQAAQFMGELRIHCDNNFSGEWCFTARHLIKRDAYKFRLQVVAACDRDSTLAWGAYRTFLKDEVGLYKYKEKQG
jgi:hypothetical protein